MFTMSAAPRAERLWLDLHIEPIIIDGSQGEGGGQMLRTSLAFSAITGKPVTIKNIRANRPKPGLARQHLTGLKLIGNICGAEVRGAEIGSTLVEFQTGHTRHGEYSIDVGTAGSITLVLQTILPALASVEGQSIIRLIGGTDVKWSPPVDYYALVLFPLLEKIGLKCSLDIEQRGYFPRGGGIITANIKSTGKLKSLKLQAISKPEIAGIVNITGLPEKIAERVGAMVLDYFPEAIIHIQHRVNGPSQGAGIVLAAFDGQTILGASSLGERGKPAEKVGKEAARALQMEIDGQGSTDVFASDQLLPYIALGGGSYSARKLTNHARTNVNIINKFMENKLIISEDRIVTFSRTCSVDVGQEP